MPEHKRLHQQHWRQHWLKSNIIWGCIDNAEKRGLFKYLVVSFLAVSESPKWNAIKITLGFWGSRVPLHKVELNGTRQNGMKWNNYCFKQYEYFWSQDFFVHWSFGFFRDICPFECGQKHLCRIYEMSIAPCNLYTRWGRLDNVWFGGFAIENDAIMHRPKILGCSDKLRQICPQYAKRPKFRRCLFL